MSGGLLDDWLYGVDLFNRFYFWEAHEAWEGLWAVAERHGAPSLLLQGLIQIAAALLKTHMGALAGACSLSAEGLAKLRRAAASQPIAARARPAGTLRCRLLLRTAGAQRVARHRPAGPRAAVT